MPIRLILISLIAYCFFVVLIYTFQRHLLYHPNQFTSSPKDWKAPGMVVIKTKTADQHVIQSWYQPAKNPSAPTIIYFHGNAGNIGERVANIQDYLTSGFGVMLVGYRGYDGNGGKPTEQGLYADARSSIEFLHQQKIPNDKLIIVGESLGSGVATQMATEYPVAALILQGAFTSIIDLARIHYPYIPIIPSLLYDKFNNAAKISQVKAPVLSLHGTKDRIVPTAIGQALYQAAKQPKKLLLYKGVGHNELFDKTPPAVIHFLKKHKIIKTDEK